MNIVADANIPLLKELFGHFGRISAIPGEHIGLEAVSQADVLLVRSVTRIDSSLLAGSNVQFVGSATAGIDHVDVDYLKREGIAFASAAGSNADSVADYVIAALLELSTITDLNLQGTSIGVIGVGAVGSRVASRAGALGLNVLLSDPPRREDEPALATDQRFRPLDEILGVADVVTVHVPLTRGGRHPTYHMLGSRGLDSMKRGAWLINTARGSVIDPDALSHRLSEGLPLEVVLDVWPDEPSPRGDLIRGVRFGTPHIAGYALDSKIRGAWMVAAALAGHLGAEVPPINQIVHREYRTTGPACLGRRESDWVTTRNCLLACARSIYDFRDDYNRFARLGSMQPDERADSFRALRRTYPARRTFSSVDVGAADPPATDTNSSPQHLSAPMIGQLEQVLGVRYVS